MSMEQFEKKTEPKIKIGTTVRVERSNGVIEDDWAVTSYDTESERYKVIKDENGRVFEKNVRREALESLNAPAES